MAKPYLSPFHQYCDDNGEPLAGGKIYSYIAGTNTELATYNSAAGDTPNTNPLVLNAGGRGAVFLAARSYKLVLKDVNDQTIATHDNIDGTEAEENNTPAWATHNITGGQSATNLSGETVDASAYDAIYDVIVKRGTTYKATGALRVLSVNGTAQVVVGAFEVIDGQGDHGLTFTVSQTGSTAQLRLAVSAGDNGTVKLSRRLVAV